MSDKIKIVSGGNASDTRVYNSDGKEIPGISHIAWECGVDGTSIVVLKIHAPNVEWWCLNGDWPKGKP